jgi:ATP-dependent DNA helicase RecG
MNLKPSINRIVIGDVGSGKTIVAFVTALTFLRGIEFGEVAMLAPTEVLAYQHYLKLLELVESQPELFVKKGKENQKHLNCIYLSGKTSYIDGVKFTPAKFQVELEKIQNGNQHIFWVGTHALLFNLNLNADLVLVDEQHRFGVRQRSKLSQKQSELQPHFVSFTATPIPRTLALTVYNSLKPHFLETLQSRSPIQTSITSFDKLETQIIPQIKNVLSQNRKVYVICPAVEETEDKEDKKALWSVTKASKILEGYFPNQVLSVHGKLNEKKDILGEFKTSQDKNILVATTVVEVGVDVAEATLVVILNAERFGLSALHQIRGRVGRNSYTDNFCILVTEKEFTFSKRLKYLCQYSDGFALAEKDLELRGAGDLVGSAQSGFGDDIDSLIGLNPNLYIQISNLVDSIDKTRIKDTLPRLEAYLQKEKSRVWEE